MSEQENKDPKPGFARRFLKVVGRAGSAVGDVTEGILRTAGQSAKNAGGRAALTFSKSVDETPQVNLRELAEALMQWLVEEHKGQADLQQQKPSTVELNELGEGSYYKVHLAEPGLAGRSFCFVLRQTALLTLSDSVAEAEGERALICLDWPQELLSEPADWPVFVWNHATVVGPRNPASDLLQSWLSEFAGGTFLQKQVVGSGKKSKTKDIPIVGREKALKTCQSLIRAPQTGLQQDSSVISLAAPGGTGKSFFLKVLKQRAEGRVKWAFVDHQGVLEVKNSAQMLQSLLTRLAQDLEEQSVRMETFRKELRSFQKSHRAEDDKPSGFFGHLRKAAETAAGVNPVLAAVSAGIVFFTSWGQEQQEESEALAKDNAIKALTEAFKKDLVDYADHIQRKYLCWSRPVLVFDTYEWLSPMIDTWLRTEFLSEEFLFQSEVSVILSGREHLLKTDTRWSGWQYLTTRVSLNPFNRAESEELLRSLGVEEERFDSVFALTEGLPLFLSLAAHIEEEDQAIGILCQRVLEEVPEKYRPHFMMASLLDSFDKKSIAKLFHEEEQEQLEIIRELLLNATFTVARDGRRLFLGPVQRILQRGLVLELGENQVQGAKKRIEDV